ncbi:MAG: RDD family protein [Microbacteriaceae bacterium]|nr:RDD family protein [Microbacteriaceae bacterium]HOA86062.1 RDD family protein [Microbacteriaceae bacterium]HPZ33678.1 RDD family protein [Microbacteriaceae bacterium]
MSAVHGMPEIVPPPKPPAAGVAGGQAARAPEPPAAFGRRVVAYLIDGAIALLVASVTIVGAIMLWLSVLGALLDGAAGGSSQALPAASLPALILVIAGAVLGAAWSIVWVAMQGGRGSIGMRLMGIRLVRAGLGTRLGFWRALGRAVVFSVLAGVVVGYVTPLFDRSGRRQGWHDLLVGAIMVDALAFDEAVAQAAAQAAAPPPAPVPAAIEEIDRDRPFGFPGARPTVPPVPGARGVGAGVAPAGASLPPAPLPPGPFSPAPLIGDVPAHLAPRVGAPAPTPPLGPAPAPAPAATPGFVAAAPSVAPPAASQLELRWDDGTVVTIPHGAVIGRDPVASTDAVRVSSKLAGATSIAVPDDSFSLSKTHFGAGVDADGAWIVDLHSTNGMILHREGVPARPLTPGALTAILAGDVVVIGDRRVTFALVVR